MQKKVLLLTAVFSFFAMDSFLIAAEHKAALPRLRSKMTIGTIQEIGLNTLEIFDEMDRSPKRLVYLPDTGQFHKGDRVRIYYDPKTKLITTIKKMTLLEYQKKGQNLGYLYRKDSTP